jgi:hypothetical protein
MEISRYFTPISRNKTIRYVAWQSAQYVMLLGSQHSTLCCLAVNTVRYVAWQSAQYVMLLGSQNNKLCCLAVSTVRYVAWQSAPTDLLFAQYTVQIVALFFHLPH